MSEITLILILDVPWIWNGCLVRDLFWIVDSEGTNRCQLVEGNQATIVDMATAISK